MIDFGKMTSGKDQVTQAAIDMVAEALASSEGIVWRTNVALNFLNIMAISESRKMVVEAQMDMHEAEPSVTDKR